MLKKFFDIKNFIKIVSTIKQNYALFYTLQKV